MTPSVHEQCFCVYKRNKNGTLHNKTLFKEFLQRHLGNLVSRPKVNFNIIKLTNSYTRALLNHTSYILELNSSFLQLRYGITQEVGIREVETVGKAQNGTKEQLQTKK